jgi:hypothetical protein
MPSRYKRSECTNCGSPCSNGRRLCRKCFLRLPKLTYWNQNNETMESIEALIAAQEQCKPEWWDEEAHAVTREGVSFQPNLSVREMQRLGSGKRHNGELMF